ncbi:MAG: virulence factor SrfB, partial [Candidatus Adiutrix sp.]|nr:virulence factor SrfB [Candidatus Adiutrix sp.]
MADRNKSYSIIAGAALQFIDYDFDLSLEVGDKPGKPLGKRRKPFHVAQDKTANKNILLPLEELADQPGEYMSPQRREIMPLHYEVEYQQAFECCQGQWLPLPFLLETGHWPDGSPRYAYGPTDWARGYLSRLGGEGSPRFRLTLVFDPRVEDGASDLVIVDGRRIQHTLTQADVAGNTSFNLAVQARDNAWFIDGLPWVKEALRNCRDSFKEKNPRRALSRLADDFPLYGYEGGEEGAGVVTEYMAVYAAMLDAL